MAPSTKRPRWLIQLVAMLVLFSPVMAVSRVDGSAAQEGSSGEVKLWTEFTAGGEKTGIEEMLKVWKEKDNGISINHRPIGNEQFFTVIRTGIAGGEPPDLLQFEGYQQTRDFAAAGQLTDLTDWWNANKSRFDLQAAGERACTYEGKVYCVPYSYATGWQIYYNPDLLAENGVEVPKTYEEFLAAAETLKGKEVTPIAMGGKDGWPAEHWYMAFLVQRCGVATVYQAIEGTAKFTDPCFVQAAGDLQNLMDKGYFSQGAASDDYGTAQAIFLSGKAAFFQTGSWFVSGWEQDPPKVKIGIMPFPRMSDTPYPDDVTGAVTHVWGIPAKAENPEAAMAVLDWMASDEGANIWAKNGNLALVAGAIDASGSQTLKELWAGVKAAEAALPWIENELPPGVGEDKVYTGCVALLTGDMTPEEFSQSIQEALDAARS